MTLPSSGPLSLNDIQTEFGGSNPIGMNEYYAGGGLVPAGTTGTYGAVPSSGALSIQNFYGTSQFVPIYIEEVFSTWLYTGTGATQTITNGINLSGSGGLVWLKNRVRGGTDHVFTDTTRGALKGIASNSSAAQVTAAAGTDLSSFTSSGFSIGTNYYFDINTSGDTYTSWTFRKQPKFFDIVTWTGNGAATQTISHSLGAAPGCIMAKATSTTGNWNVYHQSLSTPDSKFLRLNTTQSEFTTSSQMWATTTTNFTVYQYYGLNDLNVTYVAYLFAHDAGGFGLTGTDNVISCGSYAGNSATQNVNLGYEPQFILVKNITYATSWRMFDTMRGMTTDGTDEYLVPNLADQAYSISSWVSPTATGFKLNSANGNINESGANYIYIAIRRGPMKVPTSGTSVFSPNAVNAPDGTKVTTGFPIDAQFFCYRPGTQGVRLYDRLRGVSSTSNVSMPALLTYSTSNEFEISYVDRNWDNTGFKMSSGYANAPIIFWNFQRAPGFFDEVCYTGTSSGFPGTPQTLSHNLGVVPELIIIKRRDGSDNWFVYPGPVGVPNGLFLNATIAVEDMATRMNTTPTSTTFNVRTDAMVNASGGTYVAYLFASCPGVSKVGSYTGTGTTQQINCGFTGGARFVLIKRTDSTGDWYVWDSARGIVAGNDPYLLLNIANPEVTSTDYVDTYSAGFEITSTAPAAINASGGTFIFLAIA